MITGGLFLSVALFTFLRVAMQRRAAKQRIETGLVLTVHIEKMIALVQKHRGTSNAITQGNTELLAKLTRLQTEMDTLLANDNTTALQRYPQWESFIEHWPRLKRYSVNTELKPHHLIRQHNLMIDGLLSLLDDVMRYHDLHKMMLDRTTRVSEVCLDTLRVAETIAQVRGVGSGICAHGRCEGADRIIINFLKISVQTSTHNLLKELMSIENQGLATGLSQTSVEIQNSVSQLLRLIESEVVVDGQIKVDTSNYFSVSTSAIDEVLKVFGTVVQYAGKHHVKMV